MEDKLEGGCFCGRIRYEITGEPVLQLMCYCSDCRALTGTEGWAGFMVNEADFRLLGGAPTVHEKTSKEGRTVAHNFCGTCGSNLWGRTSFGLVSVAAGTLDEPDNFKPTKKVFTEHAPAWARIPAELENF